MSARKPKSAAAPVRRLSNWPGLLARFIAERRALPFEWGKNDCCLFVCDGILALTGLDPAAKLFRGKYHDALGAARLLKKHGGVEAVAEKQFAKHGWAECLLAMARRGDVVSVALDSEYRPIALSPAPLVAHYALGLCEGARVVFVGRHGGLKFVPLEHCRRAWRIA